MRQIVGGMENERKTMTRKIMSVDVGYVCAFCDHEFEVEVTFGEEAQCFGPVEQSHDGSAAEFEPGECPECGQAIDRMDCHMTAAEIASYMDEDDEDDDD